jgi:hypothetical protein
VFDNYSAGSVTMSSASYAGPYQASETSKRSRAPSPNALNDDLEDESVVFHAEQIILDVFQPVVGRVIAELVNRTQFDAVLNARNQYYRGTHIKITKLFQLTN